MLVDALIEACYQEIPHAYVVATTSAPIVHFYQRIWQPPDEFSHHSGLQWLVHDAETQTK